MRKRLPWGIPIAVLLAVSLFACGQGGTQEEISETPRPSPTAAASPVPTEAEEIVSTPEPPETVTVCGMEVEKNARKLEIPEPVSDLSALTEGLSALPELETVTLTRGCFEGSLAAFQEEWDALVLEFSDVVFTDRLLICGEPADTLEVYSVPAGTDAKEELSVALACCPNLHTADLTETDVSRETVASLIRAFPSLTVRWTDPIYGASSSDADSLAFSDRQNPDALTAYLACFPNLTEVDLIEAALSEIDADALCDRFPDTAFHRTVQLNGETFDSFTETLDFSGAEIASYESFSDRLRLFPRLVRLEMHDCSLSYEQLAEIRDRYPNVLVIWTIRFKRWTVRTDAVAFSTFQPGDRAKRLSAEDVEVLRYCRDLIALDLGHNDIKDIGWITELSNLQVLILSDNRNLKDITPLGSLTKLKYVELFLTGIEDISALANLSELLDVNLFITHVKDLSPLLSCRKLERIWIGKQVVNRIGQDAVQEIVDAFPNAEFDLESTGSTKKGWREHPRYLAYSQMFRENIAVEPFLP